MDLFSLFYLHSVGSAMIASDCDLAHVQTVYPRPFLHLSFGKGLVHGHDGQLSRAIKTAWQQTIDSEAILTADS